jgi:hypothetical protein
VVIEFEGPGERIYRSPKYTCRLNAGIFLSPPALHRKARTTTNQRASAIKRTFAMSLALTRPLLGTARVMASALVKTSNKSLTEKAGTRLTWFEEAKIPAERVRVAVVIEFFLGWQW